MKKKLSRHEVQLVQFGCKPQKVIQDGMIKNYVGIGWVTERKATKADYRRYPTVEGKDE